MINTPELDIFELCDLDLTDEQKKQLMDIADNEFIASGGSVGLDELLQILTRANIGTITTFISAWR